MIRWLVPAFVLFALAVAAVVPFGLSPAYRLLPALLPGIGIVYWSVRELRRVNAVIVFMVGLVVDFLAGSFIGQWTLGYLGVLGVAVLVSRFVGVGVGGLFAGTLLGICLMLVVAMAPGLYSTSAGATYGTALVDVAWVGLFCFVFVSPALLGLLRLLEGPRGRADGMIDYV